jgi:mannose-6-phosphate isomerase-like protein (cupin superfamily)
MDMRCNCDASCGENRYHNVGDRECRFHTVEEYEAYWGIKKTILPEPERKFSDKYREKIQELKDMTDYRDFDEIMEQIAAERKQPYIQSMKRPWGEWHVLDVDRGYKVKRLEILPDQAISLQYHNHRSEHWTIVQGKGKVIVDGNIFTVEKGESFHVPRMALHKITNTHLTETLIAIEVQMGEICSEDDIVRC